MNNYTAYMSRAPNCNPIKFDNLKEAQEWINNRHVFDENRAREFKHNVKEKSFTVRIVIISILVTAFAFVIFTLSKKSGEIMGCNSLIMKAHPICILVTRVELTAMVYYSSFISLIATEIVATIGCVFIWIFSMI